MARKQLGANPSNDKDIATKKYVDDALSGTTGAITVKDANFTIQDDGDTSKQLKFQLSGITASNTRTLTVPDATTTLVGTDATQTLTNKTISGSGNTITNLGSSVSSSGTYASLPSAGNVGRLYYCTDIGLLLRDNGSSWDTLWAGPLNQALTVPPSSGWTTINGPSATFSADLDGRKVSLTYGARSWAIEYRTPAATSNYTITAWFDNAFKPGANQLFTGLILRDSSSGYIISFGPGCSSSTTVNVMQWTSATVFSSTPAGFTLATMPGPYPHWYRIRDDGTNRYYECSHNGVDWWLVYNHARGTFVADANLRIGWGIDNESGYALVCRMRSFKES